MSYFERETDRQAKRARKTSATTSQTTAYQSNTRDGLERSKVTYARNDKIKNLLENDYAFLPVGYRAPGFLFRGLDSGINDGIRNGQFALNNGSHSLAALERELGVVLVSADFSDALSVSRLWEANDDGGILIIPASTFDKHSLQHSAATLGFAEPGVVFKYPFFANPIPVNEIAYLIIHHKQAEQLARTFKEPPSLPQSESNRSAASKNMLGTDEFISSENLSERLIIINDDGSLANRSDLSNYLNDRLADMSISKATAIQVENYPKK